MRIGLASDTHGNLDALARAFERFERADAEQVFFLGGRHADVDGVLARRRRGTPDPIAGRIVRVASRACPEGVSGEVPRTHVDLVEGRICCLVHDKAQLSRDDIANASVFFHGNSARAGIVQIGPRCFVTPGHLRADAPAGRAGHLRDCRARPAASSCSPSTPPRAPSSGASERRSRAGRRSSR